jgi:hypothetical protein
VVNLAAALIALAGFEAYLWFTAPTLEATPNAVHYSTEYYDDDPLLGYGPQKNIRTQATKRHHESLVYSATYTIDGNGLRVTPAAARASTSVLFFGGSVTFGEGLNDEYAMPYRVGVLSGDTVHVYNFGFHGYGPHQMLAAIEQRRASSIVSEPVTAVVYQAIPAHVARSAGRAPWDQRGPWYRLGTDGRVRFSGHFNDRISAQIGALFSRSLTYQRIVGFERRISDADVTLFAAIVGRARDETARKFPGSAFFVLLWGYQEDPLFEQLSAGLVDQGLTVVPIHGILPHYADDPARYQIGPHDKHPNVLAQRLIAEHITARVVGPLRTPVR